MNWLIAFVRQLVCGQSAQESEEQSDWEKEHLRLRNEFVDELIRVRRVELHKRSLSWGERRRYRRLNYEAEVRRIVVFFINKGLSVATVTPLIFPLTLVDIEVGVIQMKDNGCLAVDLTITA